jgi:hypothetical protein
LTTASRDGVITKNASPTAVTARKANSPEGQEFSRQSVHAWATVVESSGTASTDEIAAATDASLAQFAPDPGTTQNQDKTN